MVVVRHLTINEGAPVFSIDRVPHPGQTAESTTAHSLQNLAPVQFS